MSSKSPNSWHLTKGVSVSTIIVVVCNLVALVWGGAHMNARIGQNTEALVRLDRLHSVAIQRAENRITNTATKASDTYTRVIRIEEKLIAQHAILKRIEEVVKR